MSQTNIQDLSLKISFQTAKILIPKIRIQEKPDLLVVLLHSGLGESPGNVGDENVVLRLIDQVSGIDGVVSGHTHRPIAQLYKNIPIVQSLGSWTGPRQDHI